MAQPVKPRRWGWYAVGILFHLLVGSVALMTDFTSWFKSESETGSVTVKKTIRLGLPLCRQCVQGASITLLSSIACPAGIQIAAHPTFVRRFLEENEP